MGWCLVRLFLRTFDAGLQSGRTKEPLAGPGAFKRSGHFLDAGFSEKLRSSRFVTS